MRILTLEEAAKVVQTPDLAAFFNGIDWQYPDPVPSYLLPDPSSQRVGLARIAANTFLDRGSAMLWIARVNRGSSIEHMEMFDKYRFAYGETRKVEEAPVHLCEADDRDFLMSILCFGLFFSWDIEVISMNRLLAMTFSHDDWMEYRFAPGQESIIPYFEKYFGWLTKK